MADKIPVFPILRHQGKYVHKWPISHGSILASKNVVLIDEGQRVNFLLYGHDTLTFNENKGVLSATLIFIHDSKRF